MTSPAALGAMQNKPAPGPVGPSLVIHGDGVCRHWTANDFTTDLPVRVCRLPNGAIVTCGRCGRLGVLPVPGSEADFLPEDATWDPANETVTWVFR